MMALMLLFLIAYVQLGWCWADVLLRLSEGRLPTPLSYALSFLFWPLSMMLWDASQQDDEYDH